MTANAMKADLDACLAAGMNDHVIKPIDRNVLLQTLRRWLPTTRGEGTVSASVPTPESRPPTPSHSGIDIAGTIQRLGLDEETLRRMLVRFADGQAPTLDALRTAVASGDASEAARHAHGVAGAAGNLGVDALRDAAKALEQAARTGCTDLAMLLAEVEQCAAVAFRSIDTFRDAAAARPSMTTGPSDTAGARAALDRLQVALDDSELSAATCALADLTACGVPAGAEADLARLRDRMDRYDYDEAQLILIRIVEQLERTSTP
jgi:two-component system, sensor histidine kinase and response regulator